MRGRETLNRLGCAVAGPHKTLNDIPLYAIQEAVHPGARAPCSIDPYCLAIGPYPTAERVAPYP